MRKGGATLNVPQGVDAGDIRRKLLVYGYEAAGVNLHAGGCEVELLEKASLLGGTSAFSGGMPWVPMNKHMAEYGTDDSREAVLEYLATLDLGRFADQGLIETFVDRAAEAIEYLESTTPLAYRNVFRDRAGPAARPRERSRPAAGSREV